MPVHVLTQGLGTISEARHVVLLATGEGKAEAIAAAVEGPLSAFSPGSALQLHPHVTVIVDEEAASKLKFGKYYRFAYEQAGVAALLIKLQEIGTPGFDASEFQGGYGRHGNCGGDAYAQCPPAGIRCVGRVIVPREY